MDAEKQAHIWDGRQVKRAKDSRYVANRRRIERIAAAIDSMSGSAPKQTISVLNIGIGDARLERILRDRGYDMHAVDPSGDIVTWVRQELGFDETSAQQCWAQEMPFPEGHFDFVVMSEVVEHLTPEEMDAVFTEVLRVLKPGGHLIGTVPENEDLDRERFTCAQCGATSHRVGHEQTFTVQGMRRILGKRFRVVRVERFRGMYMNGPGVLYYQWIDLPFKFARLLKPNVRAPHQIVFNIFFVAARPRGE